MSEFRVRWITATRNDLGERREEEFIMGGDSLSTCEVIKETLWQFVFSLKSTPLGNTIIYFFGIIETNHPTMGWVDIDDADSDDDLDGEAYLNQEG